MVLSMEGCSKMEMPPLDARSVDGDVETCKKHVLNPVPSKHHQLSKRIVTIWLLVSTMMSVSLCIVGLVFLKEGMAIGGLILIIIFCIVQLNILYLKRHSLYSSDKNEPITSEKKDSPPSYDNVIETEQLPPSYVTAVAHNQCVSKSPSKQQEDDHQSIQNRENDSNQTSDAQSEDMLSN